MKKYSWFMILTVLLLMLGSMGMGQSEILPAHGEGQIGLQAVILCETLTVRKEPNASSKAVKTLHYGDFLIVQPQTGGWAQCFLSDDVDGGPAGWVNEDYLAIDPAWYRTEEKTPVYAWNDMTAPKVALLDENTTLPILKNEGDWLIVSLRGATGWIPVPGGASQTARQNGERFETTIMLGGMEETVLYEHAVNAAMGIEIDYDYEILQRYSDSDKEYFVSRYDDPQNPLDYLEIRRSAEDAETAAARVREELEKEYDVFVQSYALERAGSCIEVNASVIKGTNLMPDLLQTVYIIPAADGCIIAASHCTIESSEGFGHRIDYMLNTLSFLNGQAE